MLRIFECRSGNNNNIMTLVHHYMVQASWYSDEKNNVVIEKAPKLLTNQGPPEDQTNNEYPTQVPKNIFDFCRLLPPNSLKQANMTQGEIEYDSGTRRAPEESAGGDDMFVAETATIKIYAKTPGEVLSSKFVLAQLLFNIIASFLGPLGTFYLLFGWLSEGPYEWSSGPCVGVVVGSLAGSPILIFALMPVGLPEAVENGWFPRLSEKNLGGSDGEEPCWWMFPFLMKILKWRWSTLRGLAIGMIVGVVYVPIALLIARYALGPTLSTWTLIWFNVVYEVVLAIPVLLFGLLGYALEPNLDVTLERMSSHPNCGIRLLYRTIVSLRMTICPY